MDIVAHTGAVVSGIIVAVDLQLGKLADCHLRNIGQQVVRYALGILADHAALVRSCGVEVARCV